MTNKRVVNIHYAKTPTITRLLAMVAEAEARGDGCPDAIERFRADLYAELRVREFGLAPWSTAEVHPAVQVKESP